MIICLIIDQADPVLWLRRGKAEARNAKNIEESDDEEPDMEIELRRSTTDEKDQRIVDLADFHQKHSDQSGAALEKLQEVALSGGNIFRELMSTVRVASLGQISAALYEVGGRYRRNM